MKLKFFLSPVILCFITVAAISQDNYKDWQAKPVAQTLDNKYATESAVILEDSRTHEYGQDEKDILWLFMYHKRIIKVNDDKGVEMFNKVYVNIPYNAEVIQIKARSLQPDGKIVDVPANKIFEEEEDGRNYKKFALEGIEKGSQIEYFVSFKKEVTSFGLEVFSSGSTYFQKANLTLIVPEHLVFSVKGYNGFTISKDTVVNKKRIVTATEENIAPLNDDKYAVTVPYQKNVQYKLSYNLDKDKSVRLNTWNEFAKNVYSNYYTFTEKEMKAVDQCYKQLNIEEGPIESTIIEIEDKLKTHINVEENTVSDDANKIERIVKTKVASQFGFTKLFIGLLQKAGIKNQMVFPSRRDDRGIDETFENYWLAGDKLIYFPATGKFTDPINPAFRYPHVEPYYAGTTGLFLRGTTIGEFKSALAKFDTIPLQPYEKNYSNLAIHLGFNSTMDSILIKSHQSLLGYSASMYRPAYAFLPKDKQDEFTKDIIKSISNSDKIVNMKVENSAMTDGSKDLQLNIFGDITTASLTEIAGNKLLVKIGEVIGMQVQMYQEKERRLPVLLQYPHALDREITFTIPQGYEVKNLNDLNFNVTDKNSGKETMGFISSYKLNGPELKISLHEFYKEIYYPVSYIEEFRKVINAASDFNKVVLVLQKK